jgi:T5SS/PEP-CTERM-associated repeat protein
LSIDAHAVTTSWNTNASGDFTTAANWDNGAPDSDDTAVFNRGFVAYEVNFPGGFIFDPPVTYFVDYRRVRTNEVSFVHNLVPFQSNSSLSVLNSGESIIVAENAGDIAILNMTLNSLSGANASIGRAAGANGTLNVGGTFSMSGAINVGESGTGTMNVTGGGTVASADGYIGVNAGSNGQVTVSGANSTWRTAIRCLSGESPLAPTRDSM